LNVKEGPWLTRFLSLAVLVLSACASSSDTGAPSGGSGGKSNGGSQGSGGASGTDTGGSLGSGGTGGLSSTGGSATGGSSSGAGGSSSTGGAGTPTCEVAIDLVSPSNLADVVVGPNAHVTLKARLVAGTPAAPTWQWVASRTLLSGGAPQQVGTVPQDDDHGTVSLPTDVAGHYAVTAIRGCQKNFYFDAGPPILRWVVQPPVPAAPGSNVPARELRLTAADVAAGTLDLGTGSLATIAPADPSGAIVPSYLWRFRKTGQFSRRTA